MTLGQFFCDYFTFFELFTIHHRHHLVKSKGSKNEMHNSEGKNNDNKKLHPKNHQDFFLKKKNLFTNFKIERFYNNSSTLNWAFHTLLETMKNECYCSNKLTTICNY